MDFVFLLEDDTYLHLEFQTAMDREDLERFLKYDVVLYESKHRVIHTAVICGKEIQKAPGCLNHGSVQYSIEAVYMNRYDGDRIYQDLAEKVQTQETLDDLDQLNLIFLPLMNSQVSPSERAIEAVELARQVKEASQQMFLVSAVVSISDKFIDKEYVQQLIEVMKMTRVGELLYKEGRQEGEQECEQRKALEVAKKMLKRGMNVSEVVELTGLTEEEVKQIKKQV